MYLSKDNREHIYKIICGRIELPFTEDEFRESMQQALDEHLGAEYVAHRSAIIEYERKRNPENPPTAFKTFLYLDSPFESYDCVQSVCVLGAIRGVRYDDGFNFKDKNGVCTHPVAKKLQEFDKKLEPIRVATKTLYNLIMRCTTDEDFEEVFPEFVPILREVVPTPTKNSKKYPIACGNIVDELKKLGLKLNTTEENKGE